MKAYRYNSKKRSDRKFNTTGKEKNPNMVKYYASNLEYAEGYRYVYYEDGDINYECELEVVELEDTNLFDMSTLYHTTQAYQTYVSTEINKQRIDYMRYYNEAKTSKLKKMWKNNIDALANREVELATFLHNTEFQSLCDFEYQNILIVELKDKGFNGYFTKNEIVLF